MKVRVALKEEGGEILLDGARALGKPTQGIAGDLAFRVRYVVPFTLINNDEGRIPLYHIDLYRTEGNADLATIGLEDYFEGEGVIVIEWSAKGAAWLPADALHITITPLDDTRRRFQIEAHGRRAELLATTLNVILPSTR